MSQKLDHAKVATKLAELRTEEMANHVSDGFTVARAIRDTKSAAEGAEQVIDKLDLAWLKALLPSLTDYTALLFYSESIYNAVTEGGWVNVDDPHTVGSILYFHDGSLLRFDDEGGLVLDEMTVDWLDVDINEPFPNHADTQILGATPGFLSDHPDLAVFEAGLPDEVDEDLISAISEEVENAIDPPMDKSDLAGEQSWGPEDAERLEEIVKAAWIGMGINASAEFSVRSAIDEGGEAYFEFDSDIEGYDSDDVIKRLAKVVGTLIDLGSFIGHTWEYNDGAYDRRSGYSQYEETVVYIEIDPTRDFSNHTLIEAHNTLLEKLKAKGMDEAEALALIRPEALAA